MRFKMKALLEKMNRPFRGITAHNAGMSMIEIMFVVALIGILMTYIIRNVTGAADNAKRDQTKIAFNMLIQELQRYKLDNNRYPTTEQGLQALLTNPGAEAKNWRGPYTEDNKIVDPWGEKFNYESDGRTVKLTSGGPNLTIGDDDDIQYPEAAKAQ